MSRQRNSQSSIDLRRRTNAFQQRAMAGKGKGPSGKPAVRKSSASAMPRFALFALVFVVLGGSEYCLYEGLSSIKSRSCGACGLHTLEIPVSWYKTILTLCIAVYHRSITSVFFELARLIFL